MEIQKTSRLSEDTGGDATFQPTRFARKAPTDRNAARAPRDRSVPGRQPIADGGEVGRFATVLRGFDEGALEAYVSGMLRRGVGPERFLVELAGPAARHIGEEWEEDRCDFVDVTLAAGRLQRIVRSVGRLLPAEALARTSDRPAILLSCVSGEGHTLGLLMVAEFFRASGWTVALGSPFEGPSTTELAAGRHFHAVGLSVASTDSLHLVRSEIGLLRKRSRNRSVAVLAGGEAAGLLSGLASVLEADAATHDARTAPELAHTFL
jgi:MerR family transcriptional regulator, light-induced transcriptional regulator